MITVFEGKRLLLFEFKIRNIACKEKYARNKIELEGYHYTEPGCIPIPLHTQSS